MIRATVGDWCAFHVQSYDIVRDKGMQTFMLDVVGLNVHQVPYAKLNAVMACEKYLVLYSYLVLKGKEACEEFRILLSTFHPMYLYFLCTKKRSQVSPRKDYSLCQIFPFSLYLLI